MGARRQSDYFCLTYFSKLNRGQIEKKVVAFWRQEGKWGGGKTFQKIPKKQHDLSLGFDVFLFIFFSFCHSSKKKQKAVFTKVRTTHLFFLKSEKFLLKPHCCSFWVKSVWNQNERKANFILTLFQTSLGYVYVI